MSKTDQAPEPSMDEILASIRRIISDEPTGSSKQNNVAENIASALSQEPAAEDPPAQLSSPIQNVDDDILVLTDVAKSTDLLSASPDMAQNSNFGLDNANSSVVQNAPNTPQPQSTHSQQDYNAAFQNIPQSVQQQPEQFAASPPLNAHASAQQISQPGHSPEVQPDATFGQPTAGVSPIQNGSQTYVQPVDQQPHALSSQEPQHQHAQSIQHETANVAQTLSDSSQALENALVSDASNSPSQSTIVPSHTGHLDQNTNAFEAQPISEDMTKTAPHAYPDASATQAQAESQNLALQPHAPEPVTPQLETQPEQQHVPVETQTSTTQVEDAFEAMKDAAAHVLLDAPETPINAGQQQDAPSPTLATSVQADEAAHQQISEALAREGVQVAAENTATVSEHDQLPQSVQVDSAQQEVQSSESAQNIESKSNELSAPDQEHDSVAEEQTAPVQDTASLVQNAEQLAQPAETPLENSIKQMLKPMLKDWLDQNMPRLVEGAMKEKTEKDLG
ncbi:MAG: DUF2497 domain-containing protein [Pseudomonadota bacterium]